MCRGTTNGHDIYVVNVDHIEQKELYANPKWIEHHGGIPVDECIGKEIESLISSGVITRGSCCGHGKWKGTALVLQESRETLEKLGYTLNEYSVEHTQNGIYEVELKTGDYNVSRKDVD